MFCSKCGKEMPDNAKFCTSCGQKLSEIRIEQPQEVSGQEEPKDWAQTNQTLPNTGLRRWTPIVLAAALACAVIVGMLLWLYGSKKEGSKAEIISEKTAQGFQYGLCADDTVTITGIADGEATAVIIPEKLDGHSVTRIGDGAFSGCKTLANVTIPESVVAIADDAFKGCKNFTVMAPSGAYAETWAQENNVPYTGQPTQQGPTANSSVPAGAQQEATTPSLASTSAPESTPEPTPEPTPVNMHITSYTEQEPDGSSCTYTFDEAKRLVSVISTWGNASDANFYYTTNGKVVDGIYNWDVAGYGLTCDAHLIPERISYPTQDMMEFTFFDANGYPAQRVVCVYGDSISSMPNYVSFGSGENTYNGLSFPYIYSYDAQNRVIGGSCTVTDTTWVDGTYNFSCNYGSTPAAETLEELNNKLGVVSPDIFVATDDTFVSADGTSYSTIRFSSAESGLTVRTGPGKDCEKIDTLEQFACACIRGYNSGNQDWYYVVYRKGENGDSESFGWVSADYLIDINTMMNAYAYAG